MINNYIRKIDYERIVSLRAYILSDIVFDKHIYIAIEVIYFVISNVVS